MIDRRGWDPYDDFDEALVELSGPTEKTKLHSGNPKPGYQSIDPQPHAHSHIHEPATYECTLPALKKQFLSFTFLKIFLVLGLTVAAAFLFIVVPEEDPEANHMVGFSAEYPLHRPVLGPPGDLYSVDLRMQEISNANASIPISVVFWGQQNNQWFNISSWTRDASKEVPLNLKAYLFDLQTVPGFDMNTYSNYKFTLETTSEAPLAARFSIHALPSVTRFQVPIAAIILISLYVLIIFEWFHRTVAAMICAFIALGVKSQLHSRATLEGVIKLIDFQTVGLLFGMMIMVGIFSQTGFFEWLGVKAYKLSRGNLWYLTILFCLFTAILSAFLDNVTTILLITPITIKICRALNTSPILMLLSEVMFTNIGGTATIIGDPPNVIIANNREIAKSVNFANFTANIGPCIVFCMIGVFLWLWKVHSHKLTREANLAQKQDIMVWKKTLTKFSTPQNEGEFQVKTSLEAHIKELEDAITNEEVAGSSTLEGLEELEKRYQIRDVPLLISSSIVLGIVIFLFFTHSFLGVSITIAWIAVIGAMVHILVTGAHDLEQIVEKVDFGTLMFFSALFVLMETLTELGLVNWIADRLIEVIASAPEGKARLALAVFLIIWVSGIASAFIDNIPYTATLVPVIVKIANALNLDLYLLIWALPLGACLGGNGTVIGASANVVSVGLMEKEGWEVSFRNFTIFGGPITVITLVISTVYMMIIHVGIMG